MLAYLSRYTHRVAISNRRLIGMDEDGVTFRYKDYRRDGDARHRTMTLSTDEFIRRFLVHVLPRGFHRIRHYGLLATGRCKANIARARELLAVPVPPEAHQAGLFGRAPPPVSLLRRAHAGDRELRGQRPRPGATLASMESRMRAS